MTVLRAHFDGRVIVPDEPVDLPKNRTLEVQVREVAKKQPKSRPSKKRPKPFPTFKVSRNAPMITSEDVRRALDDD